MTIIVEMKTHNVVSYHTHPLQYPDSLFLNVAFLHYITSVFLKDSNVQASHYYASIEWVSAYLFCTVCCPTLNRFVL